MKMLKKSVVNFMYHLYLTLNSRDNIGFIVPDYFHITVDLLL